jgi:hypothetical protein
MKSLKELAKMAVLKQGLGSEECIPLTVREELELMEEAIRADMTGRGYHEYYVEESLEFDINWSEGCWSFLLRRRTENRWTETSTEIRAESHTFLQPEWADLFGIDYTSARFGGCWINDFKINIEERRVTFHGNFGSPHDDDTANQFSTEFWFSLTSFYVRVKTVEWDPVACSYFTVTERCYEQRDTSTWSFMQWDGEFHDPEFHFPLFQDLQ